jgi:hypothetical protein
MTDRRHSAGVVAFLENVLAEHGLCVPELEVMARAAGLLGQRQSITHAKVFKKAKKSLGIRSIRNGFGDGGEWLWRLERRPASPVSKPVSLEDTYAEALDLDGSCLVFWRKPLMRNRKGLLPSYLFAM